MELLSARSAFAGTSKLSPTPAEEHHPSIHSFHGGRRYRVPQVPCACETATICLLLQLLQLPLLSSPPFIHLRLPQRPSLSFLRLSQPTASSLADPSCLRAKTIFPASLRFSPHFSTSAISVCVLASHAVAAGVQLYCPTLAGSRLSFVVAVEIWSFAVLSAQSVASTTPKG